MYFHLAVCDIKIYHLHGRVGELSFINPKQTKPLFKLENLIIRKLEKYITVLHDRLSSFS